MISDVYCCLEMDSYGHFYKKAQTRISQCRADALWNEDFELDLDGSQTLRILCFKKQPGHDEDVIVGKCALEVSFLCILSRKICRSSGPVVGCRIWNRGLLLGPSKGNYVTLLLYQEV